jgi:cell division protein FtsI/penicillin-binding protein 2
MYRRQDKGKTNPVTNRSSYTMTRRDYKGLKKSVHKRGFFDLVIEFVREILSGNKKSTNTSNQQWKNNTSNFSNYSQKPYKNSRQEYATKIEPDKAGVLEVLGVFFGFLFALIGHALSPFIAFWNVAMRRIGIYFQKTDVFRGVFTIAFLIIALKFAHLQVFSVSSIFKTEQEGNQFVPSVILAKRGQIKIKDFSQGKTDVPVTETQVLSNVFFEPSKLQMMINSGDMTVEQAASMIAGGLNLEYDVVYTKLKTELEKEKVLQYAVLQKYISKSQRDAVEYLRYPSKNAEGKFVQPSLASWLGHDTVEIRNYPENSLLASTLGYVPKQPVPKADALTSGCTDLVKRNEERGTDTNGFYIGYFGLEQKYCSELGGINGLSLFAQDVGTNSESEKKVENGSDLYLTIDINLQKKAEEVLANAIKENTNKSGGPKNGTAVIMEAETGKVLALASSPTYNPNEFNKANAHYGYGNVASNGFYEVGSVMKPLTVAATINEYQLGTVDAKGVRKGTPADWTFEDYDEKGKVFTDANGETFKIGNADGKSYKGTGKIGLSQILRDSINTGISDIIPTIGNDTLRDYFLYKYKVSEPVVASLPGDKIGYYAGLLDEKNIGSDFQYTIFGFGQGFNMSPLQLMRAYTALANDGVMMEPVLVEQIVDENGKVTIPEEAKQPGTQVLEPTTARLVTDYLVNTIDQGYLGKQPSKGQVEGYYIAGKTGTAEVGRKPDIECGGDVSRYECNRNRGIYDHTYIGYGPERDPKYIVLVKLSEPNPNSSPSNFAENTIGKSFSELMKYTMEYYGVPKER